MRIEARAAHDWYNGVPGPTVNFVIYAENETERALLTQFTAQSLERTHKFTLHSSGYSCDHHAVTDFCFGWTAKPKPSRVKSAMTHLAEALKFG